jgi:hypothetical protein
MSILNPYSYIAGGVIAAAIGGSIYVQSTMIHSWHVKYDQDEVTIGKLNAKIADMTSQQNDQIRKTDQNVIKVVQGPKEVDTIIKEIGATKAKPCEVPVDSDEVQNAF